MEIQQMGPMEAPAATSYKALGEILQKANSMYGGMGMSDYFTAFSAAGGLGFLNNWPQIQNTRVKGINTRPAEFTKDQISTMVQNPDGSEKSLRAVSASLAYSTKTYDLILKTYPDTLTYSWYVYPTYTDAEVSKKDKLRDMLLAQRLVQTVGVKEKAHELCGLCMKYGKVFVTPRISVDKSHNKINYAFLQELPMDWCKIVGYNNGPGKYTVAFNLFYFMRPGNDWRQFGDLFEPYMRIFDEVVVKTPGKYVYNTIDTDKFKAIHANETIGNPEWVAVGRQYFYWVTLPADRVFTIEVDDTTPLVIPPNTGMFVSLTQIPNYEAAQLEIILNPLTSVLTGSLETYDPKSATDNDPIRVSDTTRKLFEYLWYQMLNKNNTSGIGLYLAPAKDLKLQTISDTVANTDISSTAYSDQILKAGLPSLIPTTNDPKVGVAQLSAWLAASYAKFIYGSMERIINWMIESLNCKTPMRFKMFGDIFKIDDEIENARKGMTNGCLTDTLKYDALSGHTILDDIAISDFVDESGVMDKRRPLVTSYSAKQDTSGLPPQAKKEISEDGRPEERGSINSETHEEEI